MKESQELSFVGGASVWKTHWGFSFYRWDPAGSTCAFSPSPDKQTSVWLQNKQLVNELPFFFSFFFTCATYDERRTFSRWNVYNAFRLYIYYTCENVYEAYKIKFLSFFSVKQRTYRYICNNINSYARDMNIYLNNYSDENRWNLLEVKLLNVLYIV